MSINIKPENKGKLHKALHISKDSKIPVKKLEKANKNAGPALKKEIVFAENAKKWSKK